MNLALSDCKVNLRLIQADDLPFTLDLRNNPKIGKWFFDSQPIKPRDHLAWYEDYKTRGNDFVFIVEEAGTQKPIGQISLYNIDWKTETAEFGRLMIALEYQHKGYAHAATKLLTDAAIEQWHIQEIDLATMATNIVAMRIYEKCGFRVYAVETVGIFKMRRCANG